MKKILMIATVPSMIGQFNMNNISILLNMGYEVHVACDWTNRSVWPDEKVTDLKNRLEELKIKYYQIDYSRSMFDLKKHIISYKQTVQLLKNNEYEFIHCHTPIASAIARYACKKMDTKCIYTAHGFHFFKGAPKINWLLFYPIEKLCSYWTDILITINREDYQRAKKSFHAKKIEYVPGVGIDLKKFQTGLIDVEKKRKELGLGDTETMLLSVGELSTRKNHEVVIKALGKLQNKKMLENVHYFICGKGELLTKLKLLVHELELDSVVKFLGFRQDISELCQAADLFIFPSLQEGLPVALMEAIACKTPVICSKIRGNEDLINCKDDMFQAMDVESVFINIKEKCVDETGEIRRALVMEKMENNVDANYRILQRFSLSFVDKRMHQIYQDIM